MDLTELHRVRVVLVATTHPGNIGAAARAMWAMGLDDLRLVRPKIFPSAEATARASGADALLYRAPVHDDLADAVADCAVVVATTARARRLPWPELTPRDCARRLLAAAVAGPVALVFGREHAGLTNDELGHCNAVSVVPANPAFASLNLAAAVQIYAYELRAAWLEGTGTVSTPAVAGGDPLATAAELEGFYAHLEQVLADTGYLDRRAPRMLMRRMRRLFARSAMKRSELNILRGVFAAVQRLARRDTA